MLIHAFPADRYFRSLGFFELPSKEDTGTYSAKSQAERGVTWTDHSPGNGMG